MRKSSIYLNRIKNEALKGDVDAQFNLALYYDEKQDVKGNSKLAFYWYRKAALQGDFEAKNNLGWCYSKGYGVSKNLKKAFFWYKKAADQKDIKAYYHLGLCYLFGEGTNRNKKKALKYLLRAARNGHKDAQLEIQWQTIKEFMAKKQWKKARKALRLALKITPKDHFLLTELALLNCKEKKYKDSVAISKKILKSTPDCPINLYNYGEILERIGSLDKALVLYNKIIKLGIRSLIKTECSEGKRWAKSLLNDSYQQRKKILKKIKKKREKGVTPTSVPTLIL